MSKMKRILLLVGQVLLKTMIIVIISMMISLLIKYFTGVPLIPIIEYIAVIIVIVGVLSMLGDMVVRGHIQYNLTKFLRGAEKSTKEDRKLTYDGYIFSFYTCLAGAILFLITIFIYWS